MIKLQVFSRLLITGFFLVSVSAPLSAGVFENYSGSWRGTGQVILGNGRREALVCSIKSTVEVNGTRAYHNVRCKSDSEKIFVRIRLRAKQRVIVGTWSASGAVAGNVHGKASGKSLNLRLSGRKITALLKLSAANCRQKMSLTGNIGNIRKITVQLKKNC